MHSNTNPNSFGGSFNYDSRTGLGIGSTSGKPTSGVGSTYDMGDALSSPVGEYDVKFEDNLKQFVISADSTIRELCILAGLINSEDLYDKDHANIENKSFSSFHVGATDSLSHKGKDISSLGGLGNSISSVIGLSAGRQIQGEKILESNLKSYIKEVILNEKNNISGNVTVRSTGKKGMYNNMQASTNTSDAAPVGHLPANRHGINYGYGQKRLKTYIKSVNGDYVELHMNPTTTGSETIKNSSSQISIDDFDDGETSTFEILAKTSDQNFIDKFNVSNKNKNLNIYK